MCDRVIWTKTVRHDRVNEIGGNGCTSTWRPIFNTYNKYILFLDQSPIFFHLLILSYILPFI